MPEFFRIDGGLATHWMLPGRVELARPPGAGSGAVLDRYGTRYAINRLHARGALAEPPLCPGDRIGPGKRLLRRVGQSVLSWPTPAESLQTVEEWLRDGSDPHRQRWNCLCEHLAGERCLPGAGCPPPALAVQ